MKLIATLMMLMPALALATYNTPDPEPVMTQEQAQLQDQIQDQAQAQDQSQAQEQVTAVDVALAQEAVSSTSGNAQSVSLNAAPNVVMVPNNNTESCLRVIGLSFANTSGGGGLGIPLRSKKCDYEAAADDAFAQGQMNIGWFWKCQNKALYKKFGSAEECHSSMMGMMVPLEKPPVQAPSDKPAVLCCSQNCSHPEEHERIFEKCQSKR